MRRRFSAKHTSLNLITACPEKFKPHGPSPACGQLEPTCARAAPHPRIACARLTSEVQPKSNKPSPVPETAGDNPSLRRDGTWWRYRTSVMQMGAKFAVDARPGEHYADYKDRV